MLCFVFAALVVILDQLFKHWITLSVELHGHMDFIPGLIGLTNIQNKGAAFSILSGQRWLLAGISLAATIVLIFILLRYTEGFWGSLGLAAVLGGTVGNLIDRVFQGYVVDMFRPLFTDNFAIFNIADIFLTLGFTTFCIHFIITFIKSIRDKESLTETTADEEVEDDDPYSIYDVPDGAEIPDYDTFSDTKDISDRIERAYSTEQPAYSENASEQPEYYESISDQQDYNQPVSGLPGDISSALDALENLESELGSIADYDTDDLLREYGFDS